MERRRFLAGLSATVPLALAGCLGGQGDEDTTSTTAPTDETTTQTPDQTTTTTDSGPMSVGEKTSLGDDRAIGVVGTDATAFVLTRGGTDRQVHAGNTTRHVLVTFNVDSVDDYESLVAENVTLTINDEETFSDPIFPLGGGANQFTAAYAVPNDVTAYTGSVDLDTGDTTASWAFSARDIESITQSVDFEVTNVTAPDTVAAEAEFGVDLEIDNSGDAFEFVTTVKGTASAPTYVTFDVPASKTVTKTLDLTAPAAAGASEFHVELDWGANGFAEAIPFE